MCRKRFEEESINEDSRRQRVTGLQDINPALKYENSDNSNAHLFNILGLDSF